MPTSCHCRRTTADVMAATYALLASAENPATNLPFGNVFGSPGIKDLDTNLATQIITHAVENMFTNAPACFFCVYIGTVSEQPTVTLFRKFKRLSDARTYHNSMTSAVCDTYIARAVVPEDIHNNSSPRCPESI